MILYLPADIDDMAVRRLTTFVVNNTGWNTHPNALVAGGCLGASFGASVSYEVIERSTFFPEFVSLIRIPTAATIGILASTVWPLSIPAFVTYSFKYDITRTLNRMINTDS